MRPILEKATEAALVEAAVTHAATYPSERSTYSEAYTRLLDVGHAASALNYASMAIWRREFHGRLLRVFRHCDALIAPVMPTEPPLLEAFAAMLSAPPLSVAPLLAYTIQFNLAGVPTLTLPMGSEPSNGPLGFQLIGPDLSEALLLSVGAAYEQAAGTAAKHPTL